MATYSAKRDNIENKYRALDIATGDEPEPLFIKKQEKKHEIKKGKQKR